MSEDTTLPRPLEGITILDLTTALAGPYATLILAGLGARVIKVENPRNPDSARTNSPYLGREGLKVTREHDDDLSLAMLERGRNKEAVTLNMKHPEGRALFLDLVKHADAVVENYSAGVADRLGIGYRACAEVNPRIVFTSISGFGANVQPRQNKAMDNIVQAMSGMMLASGNPGDPPVRTGIPFGDLSAPLFAAIGTLAALMQARATGRGQHVDVSLLGALSSLVAAEPFEIMAKLGHPTRAGNFMARLAPFGVFPTSDGYIAICAPKDDFVSGLFRAMDRPDLMQDARFATRDARVRNHVELHDMVSAFTRTMTTDAAADRLTDFDVPNGPVREPAEALRDPTLLARGETAKLQHPVYGAVEDIVVGGLPIRMSGAFTGFDKPAVTLGASNDDVYGQMLGLDAERIAALARDGVI
ncbi:carnitine dehydratase [Massilia sp. Root133]|uniref:CoA transferase n=1 Tax=Massilia cellulosiltytica TaxID=2683234 RepID=A0A7X3FXT4_9BURK|nr:MULTISPECIES: CoA transferase [Telluria group]KQY15822.1 carnitine dehydratase [Massilia sp. Root133]KQZ44554.1 carnitine dehydratase [Massilia sp. Root1485]MVW59932.1 CoA transferase [Telluria cellulosilytica]